MPRGMITVVAFQTIAVMVLRRLVAVVGLSDKSIAQGGDLGAHPGLGEVGEDRGSRSPAMRASIMARPETLMVCEATVDSLMPASSRIFCAWPGSAMAYASA